MPEISIICVTWNAEQALPETMESIYRLGLPDYEIIIVDGASTDGTVAYIQSQGNRIHQWVTEKDQGIYDAMNKGLKMAKGEFIWFLNAGDLAFPGKALEIIQKDSSRADVYYGDTLMESPEGNALGLRRGGVPAVLSLEDLRTGMLVSHQSLIVRRSIAPTFDIRYRYVADLDWLIRILKSGARVQNLGEIVSVFRTGGTSTQNWRKAMIERFNCLHQHFGLVPTLLNHLLILLRMPFAHAKYRH